MSGANDNAIDALKDLLAELPYEFSHDHPDSIEARESFKVITKSNVRKVHQALWELQEYFGLE